jgi:CheY-like chemotaxis protein
MPKGGKILIEARAARGGPGKGLKPGDYVRLSVIDRGAGMDEATLARAMEPFFTTKGVGKGTGLGLSMVHGFAEQLGGRLLLKSRIGKGTTAELWLPVAAAESPQAGGNAPDETAARSAGGLVILAVDDDALVLTNTAAILEDLGHRVLQATSGRQALRIAEEAEIDLVVTDYAMPEMTGAQLAEEIRLRQPDMSVLIVSGFAELPADAATTWPRLGKPFREAQLARAIEDAIVPRAVAAAL